MKDLSAPYVRLNEWHEHCKLIARRDSGSESRALP